MAHRHMERHSTSLVVREIQIKREGRYPSIGQDMEKWESSNPASGNINDYYYSEKHFGISKTDYMHIPGFNNPIFWNIPYKISQTYIPENINENIFPYWNQNQTLTLKCMIKNLTTSEINIYGAHKYSFPEHLIIYC